MRVGPHVNNLPAWGQGVVRFKAYVDRVRPPMVKFIDTGFNDDAIAYAVARVCQVVGRIVFDDGDQPIDNDAKRKIAKIVESARKHPQITWWEFYNEAYEKGDEMARYSERSIEFMQAMDAIGKKAMIGGFSTGTPDESQWPRFRPAVEYAWWGGHGICVHQYSAPDMRYMAGLNQWNNGNPRLNDPVLDPKAEGWHTLRHRKALKVFEAWGVSARFFIGESGNDDIQQRPGGPGKGWKDWRSSSLKLGDFADQLRWLGWQYSHDPSVVGWVDYGWGSTDGGDERWKHFDLSSDTTMLDRVMALQLELPRLQHAVVTPTPPTPIPPTPTPPTPAPIPGTPLVPRVTAAIAVTATPNRGEGWAMFAGRVAGHPTASFSQRMAWASEIAAANGVTVNTSVEVGRAYLVPWFKAMPK